VKLKNLLSNPGFETNNIEPWEIKDIDFDAGEELTVTSLTKKSGNYGLKVKEDTGNYAGAIQRLKVLIKGSTVYTYSAYIYIPSGVALTGNWELHRQAYPKECQPRTPGGAVTCHHYNIIAGDYTWENSVARDQWIRKYITIAVDADVDTFIGWLGTSAEGTGTVYFDDVQLEEDNEVSDFSDNTYIVGYTYDKADNIETIGLPNENIIEYTYNILNQIENVKLNNEIITEYTYNPTNTIYTLNFLISGISTTYNYWARDWVKSIDYSSSLQRYYEYDPAGNLKRYFEGVDVTGQQLTEFDYDVLDRLTSAQDITGALYFGDISYSYDDVGNRLSKNDDVYLYYPGTNRLKFDGTNIYEYDENGNVIRKSKNLIFNPSFENDFDGWGFPNWDGSESIILSDFFSGSKSAMFSHDGSGNGWTGVWQLVPVIEGQTYTISARIKVINAVTGTGSTATINYYFDANGIGYDEGHKGTTTIVLDGSNDQWQFHSETFTVPVGMNYVWIAPIMYGSGEVYYDNIQFEKDNTATEFSLGTLYSYDHENRLVKVELSDGGIVEYVYDAVGKRVIKKSDEKATVFIYDQGGNLIYEDTGLLCAEIGQACTEDADCCGAVPCQGPGGTCGCPVKFSWNPTLEECERIAPVCYVEFGDGSIDPTTICQDRWREPPIPYVENTPYWRDAFTPVIADCFTIENTRSCCFDLTYEGTTYGEYENVIITYKEPGFVTRRVE